MLQYTVSQIIKIRKPNKTKLLFLFSNGVEERILINKHLLNNES